MKNWWVLLIVVLALIVAVYFIVTSTFETTPESILVDRVCEGVRDDCPPDYVCVKFPSFDNPVCAIGNPCDYYICPEGECIVGESYPLEVVCE